MSDDDIPEVNVDFDDWDEGSAAHAASNNKGLTDHELDFSEIDQMVNSIGKSPRSIAHSKAVLDTPPKRAVPRPLPKPVPRKPKEIERSVDLDALDSLVDGLDALEPLEAPPEPAEEVDRDESISPGIPTSASPASRDTGSSSSGGSWVSSQSKVKSMRKSGAILANRGSGSASLSEGSRIRMKYKFNATKDTELTVAKGDIVILQKKQTPDWWLVKHKDDLGFVPATYVEPAPPLLQRHEPQKNLSPTNAPKSPLISKTVSTPPAASRPMTNNVAAQQPASSQSPTSGIISPRRSGVSKPSFAKMPSFVKKRDSSTPEVLQRTASALSPRAKPKTFEKPSTTRPLAPLGNPDDSLDQALLQTADRYRKMTSAFVDLAKKLQQTSTQAVSYSDLVAKVLQKAQKQQLAPEPMSVELAAILRELGQADLRQRKKLIGAVNHLSPLVDKITGVNDSLKQQKPARDQFDKDVQKYLKDVDKGKKQSQLNDVEANLKSQREKHDEALFICDTELRYVFQHKVDATASCVVEMIEAQLSLAKAHAAQIDNLEKLLKKTKMAVISGEKRREFERVTDECDKALIKASSASSITDQQQVQLTRVRGQLSDVSSQWTQNITDGLITIDVDRTPLRQFLVSHDLAPVTAMCVAGRGKEEALLDHLCFALDANQELLPAIEKGVEKVVGESEHAETLFRANTAATKLIGAFTRLHGREYLRQFIEPLIEKIEKDGLEYEVNPTLASGGDVEANAQNLRKLAVETLQQLCQSGKNIPQPMRHVARKLHKEVGARFPEAARSSVGGYICLRFVCPAMMAPRGRGVVNSDPSARVTRAMTLVAKLFQNVANGIEFKKEAFMIPFNDFVVQQADAMNRFLDSIIAPDTTSTAVPLLATDIEARERDMPSLHWFIVNNLPQFVKSTCDYKQYGVVPDLCTALAVCGLPPSKQPDSLK